jgi:hypothetical protein
VEECATGHFSKVREGGRTARLGSEVGIPSQGCGSVESKPAPLQKAKECGTRKFKGVCLGGVEGFAICCPEIQRRLFG